MSSPIIAVINGAIKAASILLGVSFGKITILPLLLATIAYFNYDLIDPENHPRVTKNLRKEYDFVVIGGGSAGSVVVNRLTENSDWSVLLLEAGGHESEISDVPILSLFLHKSKLDWMYQAQPQDNACLAMTNRRSCWTRGKVLGGSSVLNTMLYVRGNRRDFDSWQSLGNPGWNYENVLPYFKKSEDQRNPYLARNKRYHSTGGYLTVQDAPYLTPLGVAFLKAGKEMGYDIIDINGEQQTGFAFFQYTMRRASRCSTAKAFVRPIQLRKNFDLSLWSHVTRILIDPRSKRAYGVKFIRNGREEVVFAKKEVILSAGAINSVQLLMLSGVGPRDHLEKLGIPVIQDSPGVGQNLQDHIGVGGIIFPIDYSFTLSKSSRIININTALRYAVTEDGPLTSSIGIETVGFISTKYANKSDDWPDIEFMLVSSGVNNDRTAQVAHGLSSEYLKYMYDEIKETDSFTIIPMLLRPKSRGYIKLKSKNPLEPPLMVANYLTHPDDLAVLREGVKAAIALGETSTMKKFGSKFYSKSPPNCRHIPQYTDEFFDCIVRQYTMTIYHMSCTARMGPLNDPMAVVDPELKVYGVAGLRVIDASIMPDITSGNINAPVIMLAEKGADLVKATWMRRFKRNNINVAIFNISID
ncbi:glucose dehydrogenase [FAD, quinone]-like [Pseudomyrmex gracilis]|uniref:glucose dehydrogenase [FAD, quinone]-like n=1 Tax=Pseudomyrmex gracilis TaxID=219809 RepID=UPI000995C38C|nr:glucose dehydrogenase [FAD, quinone]-like [Pseudomyrmex gracilis]